MSFIVSANYLDRGSIKKWLVREKNATVETATPYLAVTATNVQFIDSDIEDGFGCCVVAEAEQVNMHADNRIWDGEVELSFHTDHFRAPDGKEVKSCAKLRLTTDGSVFATLIPEHQPEETKATEPADATV